MMPPLFDRQVAINRSTALIVDRVAAAASVAIDRQPVRASKVQVEVFDLSGSGTVTVGGTREDGSTGSEDLDYTASDVLETDYAYTALDALTTSGLSGTELLATAIGRDGSPQLEEYEVAASQPAALVADGGSWPTGVPGSHEIQRGTWLLMWSAIYTPRSGDVLTFSGQRWRVERLHTLPDPSQPSHWELTCRLIG